MANRPLSKVHSQIFKGLSQEQLDILDSISEEISLGAGRYLMKEGEPATELYIVLEGSLSVIKKDHHGHTYVIETLGVGDTVGELSFLDQEPRSASVRASRHCRLKKIKFEDIENLAKQDVHLRHSLLSHLSKNVSQKLRETSSNVVKALKHRIREYDSRAFLGRFFIILVTFLSVIVYTIPLVRYEFTHARDSIYISIPIICCATLLTLFVIKISKLPLEVFGITLKRWRQSAYEGLLMCIPIFFLTFLLKFLLIRYIPAYKEHHLFEFFSLSINQDKNSIALWAITNISYAFFVPLQELIARGCMQGLLERLLAGKRRVLASILISNLLFSTCHVFLSESMAAIAFLGGLLFGLLYSRTHNLIGPIICHVLVGIWTLGILGVIIK